MVPLAEVQPLLEPVGLLLGQELLEPVPLADSEDQSLAPPQQVAEVQFLFQDRHPPHYSIGQWLSVR